MICSTVGDIIQWLRNEFLYFQILIDDILFFCIFQILWDAMMMRTRIITQNPMTQQRTKIA